MFINRNVIHLFGFLIIVFNLPVWSVAPNFITIPDTSAEINSEWSYSIEAEDEDGDVVSYSVIGLLPSWLSMEKEVIAEVTTLAGDGTGNVFDCPTDIAIDSDGNLFVTTLYDNYIRKVTPEGEVSIFAGNGSAGAADGVGTEATFNGPIDVEIDKYNNLFISDYYNHSVRKITPDAVVTTYVGTDSGYADGNGTAAMFAHPVSIAADTNGNLFVCDYYNNCIRKVDSNREVTTVVGSLEGGFVNGVGTDARLARPTSIDIDKEGNLYVADRYNECIRKITPDFEVTTLAGNGYPGYVNGVGSDAQFNYPRGVAVDDDGFVYVADLINNRVRRITPEGVVSTLVGSNNGYFDGIGENALLNHPAGFGVVGSDIIYLADRENQRIRKISLKEIPTLVGTPLEREEIGVTIRATDGYLNTDQSFTIDVKGMEQSITFNELSEVIYGDASFTLSATSSSGLSITYSSSNENVAVINNDEVTIVGVGTTNIIASQPGNSSYEPALDVDQILTVNKKPVTITGITANNKVYDKTANAIVTEGNIVGLINSDNVEISIGSAVFNNENVGNDKAVELSGYTITGDDSFKYDLLEQPSTNTANITNKILSINSVSVSNKEYDGDVDANFEQGQLDSVISGDDVSLTCTLAQFDNKSVGDDKSVNISGCTLTGEDSNNYSLFSTTYSASANITAKPVNIEGILVDDKVYDGNLDATFSGVPSINGIVKDDDVEIKTGILRFVDKNAGANKDLMVSGFSLSGEDAGNYQLIPLNSLNADISRRPVVIDSIVVNNKVYDGTIAATANDGIINGLIAGDDLAIVKGTLNFSDKNVGADKVVIATGYSLLGTDESNYTLTSQPNPGVADISPKSVSITEVSVNDKIYDGSTNAEVIGYTINEKIINDNVIVNFSRVDFSDKNVGELKNVTVSEYFLSGDDASNYLLPVVSIVTTATIGPRSLTVANLIVEDKVYDRLSDATIIGTPLLENVVTGDSVDLVLGNTNFEDKNAGTEKKVFVTGLMLSGKDALNYTIPSVDTLNANILTKTLYLSSAVAKNREYDATDNCELEFINLSGIVLGDTVSVNSSIAKFSDKNVGEDKSVIVSGGTLFGADCNNYNLSNDYILTTASISSKTLSVSGLSVADKVYDGTTMATLSGVVSLSGVIAEDNVSVIIGTASFNSKDVDNDKDVIVTGSAISGTDAGNYSLAEPIVLQANVTPLGVTISDICAEDKMYDRSQIASVNGGVVNSLFSGDTVNIKYGKALFSDFHVGKGKKVEASEFSLTGSHAGNYYLIDQPTIKGAQITPKEVMISNVIAQNKTYDGTTDVTFSGGVLSGIISGDEVEFISGNASFEDKNVGTNKKITITDYRLDGDDKNSYVLLSQPVVNTANIVPKKLFIMADDQLKVEGEDDPLFTVTFDGLVEGEDLSVITGLAIERESGESIGEYYITPSSAIASNYDISFFEGILTIDKATLVTPNEDVTVISKGIDILPFKNIVSIEDDNFPFLVQANADCDVKIKIYDNLGNELDEQTGVARVYSGKTFKWNMKNKNGIKVAPGTYVIVTWFTFNDGSKEVRKRYIKIKK